MLTVKHAANHYVLINCQVLKSIQDYEPCGRELAKQEGERLGVAEPWRRAVRGRKGARNCTLRTTSCLALGSKLSKTKIEFLSYAKNF